MLCPYLLPSLLTQEGGVRDLGHDVVLHRVHVQAAHTRPPHVGQHARLTQTAEHLA